MYKYYSSHCHTKQEDTSLRFVASSLDLASWVFPPSPPVFCFCFFFCFLLFFFLLLPTPCEEWFSFNPSMFGTRFLLSRPGVKGILRSHWAINKVLGHISMLTLWRPGYPSWAFHLWNLMARMRRRHLLLKAPLHVSSSLCQVKMNSNALSWERRNAGSRQLNKNINTVNFQQKLIFTGYDSHRQEKRKNRTPIYRIWLILILCATTRAAIPTAAHGAEAVVSKGCQGNP